MDMDSSSIRDLVVRAQRGSREAFDLLFRRHQARLDGLIALRVGRMLRFWIECEDIAQQTWLVALQDIRKFQWRGEGSFYRWLAGIAEHVILRHARDQTKGENGGEMDPERLPAPGDSPSTDMRRWERFVSLRDAVGRLSDDHREVVISIYFRGLRVAEVATRMDRSADAIHMLHLRAVRKLRGLLGNTDSLRLPPVGPEDWGLDEPEEPGKPPSPDEPEGPETTS
jgi:RNA polymerase sigma-70 factor (ECF subfamily)